MKKIIISHEEQIYINKLHAGDYLPRHIAPMVGLPLEVVRDCRGSNTYEYHMKLEVTEAEYRKFVWFRENVGTPSNWYDMGKPEAPEMKAKKTVTCTCKHCSIQYEAQRKSSQFCTPAHRVAYNRAEKRKAKNRAENAIEKVREICLQVYEVENSRQAVIQLEAVRELIDKYLSAGTRLWMCHTCGKQFYGFVPVSKDCACGLSHSQWYIIGSGKV